MTEAGLVIREDTIGNVYGVLEGAEPSAPAVGTGSHCDAIPLAGAFDGTLGASQTFRESGRWPAQRGAVFTVWAALA